MMTDRRMETREIDMFFRSSFLRTYSFLLSLYASLRHSVNKLNTLSIKIRESASGEIPGEESGSLRVLVGAGIEERLDPEP